MALQMTNQNDDAKTAQRTKHQLPHKFIECRSTPQMESEEEDEQEESPTSSNEIQTTPGNAWIWYHRIHFPDLDLRNLDLRNLDPLNLDLSNLDISSFLPLQA
jgi:hypothetical protein